MIPRMTLTTHALVGAAAASLFPAHPYAAFAAGFASHFAIDALPHWDYTERWLRSVVRTQNPLENDMRLGLEFERDVLIIGADALLGAVLVALVFTLLHLPLAIALVGAAAGIYPDLLQFVYYKTRTTWFGPALEGLQEFHAWVQKGKERYHWSPLKGLGLQLLLAAAAIALVRIFM